MKKTKIKKDLSNKIKEIGSGSKIRGITLISLVITVVVLIILASVAINLTLGNNGIFNRAKTAKEQYQNAQDYEEREIGKISNEIDSYVGNTRDGMTYTVLFDVSNDWNSLLTTENDYITLENVSSYDFLLVYVGNTAASDERYVPQIVYKGDYGYDIRYEMGNFSSNISNEWGKFKIDSENNKIILTAKGTEHHGIYRVIGIK